MKQQSNYSFKTLFINFA
jgi:hypothetical protein